MSDNGGPAFPHAGTVYYPGISKLEFFAAAALMGMWANGSYMVQTRDSTDRVASLCFDQAAAMLAESERREKE